MSSRTAHLGWKQRTAANALERTLRAVSTLKKLTIFADYVREGKTLCEASRLAGVSPQRAARFADQAGLEVLPTSKYLSIFLELSSRGQALVKVSDKIRDPQRIRSIIAKHKTLGFHEWSVKLSDDSHVTISRIQRKRGESDAR